MKMSVTQTSRARQQQELSLLLAKIPPLSLSLPPLRKEKLSKTALTPPLLRWQNYQGHPEELLAEIYRFLMPLNRRELSLEDRKNIADQLSTSASRAINLYYNEYVFSKTAPASAPLRSMIGQGIELVGQLCIAYKHLFRQTVDELRARNAAVMPMLHESGFRVIECINTLQRLMGLENKMLPRQLWMQVNQVFYVLELFSGTTIAMEQHPYLRLRREPQDGRTIYTGEKPRAARQLYISMQVFGMCDAHSWPPEQLHMNDAYLSMCKTSGMIVLNDGRKLGCGYLLVDASQSHAPKLRSESSQGKPGVLINIMPLMKRVTADLNLYNSADDKCSPALASLNHIDRLPFLRSYARRLYPQARKEVRIPTHEQGRTLRVFIGFQDSHRSLCRLDPDLYSSYMKSREFAGMPEGKSTAVTKDDGAMDTGKWLLVDESMRAMRIRTYETNIRRSVSVGQVIAFQELDCDVDDSLHLGYVYRVQRNDNQELELAIMRISSAAEGIVVRRKRAGTSQAPVMAFLTSDREGDSTLVIHAAYATENSELLSLESGDLTYDIRLGDKLAVQREFASYRVIGSRR